MYEVRGIISQLQGRMAGSDSLLESMGAYLTVPEILGSDGFASIEVSTELEGPKRNRITMVDVYCNV